MIICSIQDCELGRVYLEKGGLCRKHYVKYKTGRPCEVKDCNRKVMALNKCNAHRRREKLYGDVTAGYNFRQGQTKTLAYKSWAGAKERTTSPRAKDYAHYGGRGITMCEGWANSSKAFIDDMGERPSSDYSLDRIDNEGNYSCGKCEQCISNNWTMNCRWATREMQQRNKSHYHRPTTDTKAFYSNGKRVNYTYDKKKEASFEEFVKLYCPELNNIQLKMLVNKVDELIGSNTDLTLLRQQGNREEYKKQYYINLEKDKIRGRL